MIDRLGPPLDQAYASTAKKYFRLLMCLGLSANFDKPYIV
jgi:hypothetical protein